MPKNLFVRRLPDGDAVLLVRDDGALLLPVHAAGGDAGVQVRRPRAHLPPAHRRLNPQDSGKHTDLLREPSDIFIDPPFLHAPVPGPAAVAVPLYDIPLPFSCGGLPYP